MKVVVVKPFEAVPEIVDIPGDANRCLPAMQSIVDGYIEVGRHLCVSIGESGEQDYILVVNEDGVNLNLPPNRGLFVGTFFVCKIDGDDMMELTDDFATAWKNHFDMTNPIKHVYKQA